VLTGGQAEVRQTTEGITIKFAPADQQPISTIIALKFSGSVMDLPAVSVGGGSLAEGAKATASNVFGRDPHFAASAAVDGDDETRWATDGGTRQAWLEVDFGKAQTLTRVRIDEWAGGGKRVQSFELQTRDGGEWTTIHGGRTIGPNREIVTAPVTAGQIRLNILDATAGPTINEFQVFPR
jgi:alpha-L-fucosidase